MISIDALMAKGLVLNWAERNRTAAPFAAELVAKEVLWPADEILEVLRSSPMFRCVHVQHKTEFFALVANLPPACR